MIGGYVLYRILELSFEDSALIKLFFFVWWSNNKQRQLVSITDGQWWRKRRLGVLGEGLREEKEKEMDLLRYQMYLYPTRLTQGKFGSPGQADPTQIRLGEIRLAWASGSNLNFTTLVKISYLILKMISRKSQRSEFARLGFKSTVQI